MNQTTMRTVLALSAVIGIGGGAFLLAGPLNPPAGPVSAGGKTTQEIYDAVTGLSGNIGSVGGRGPAVPGANVPSGGTIAVTGNASTSFSGPITGMRLSCSSTWSTGGGGGAVTPRVLAPVTVTRELGPASARSWRLHTSAALISTATITVPCSGGSTVYTLSDCRVVGFRNYSIQRADGTMAAMEEIDFATTSLGVVDSTGNSYSYNFSTGQGS